MSKEYISGLVPEAELAELAGGNDTGVAVASIGDVISLITDILCPSSACTNSGYCK